MSVFRVCVGTANGIKPNALFCFAWCVDLSTPEKYVTETKMCVNLFNRYDLSVDIPSET